MAGGKREHNARKIKVREAGLNKNLKGDRVQRESGCVIIEGEVKGRRRGRCMAGGGGRLQFSGESYLIGE